MNIITEKYNEIHPDNINYELGWWRDIIKEENPKFEFPLLNRSIDK